MVEEEKVGPGSEPSTSVSQSCGGWDGVSLPGITDSWTSEQCKKTGVG